MKTLVIEIRKGVTLNAFLWGESAELNIGVRPAVLVFPGGGYRMCSDREAEPVALSYLAEGYNTFILRYTVNEGFEKPFEEACMALDLIRNNAKEWGVDPDKIAVCGFSAGGHLACAMGSMAKNKPNAMILGYPALLRETNLRIEMDVIDMVEKVNKDTVPTFVFATCDDTVTPVQNSIYLLEALHKNNVPFESHIYPSGAHGLSLAKAHTCVGRAALINDTVSGWFSLSLTWLKKLFGEIKA